MSYTHDWDISVTVEQFDTAFLHELRDGDAEWIVRSLPADDYMRVKIVEELLYHFNLRKAAEVVRQLLVTDPEFDQVLEVELAEHREYLLGSDLASLPSSQEDWENWQQM